MIALVLAATLMSPTSGAPSLVGLWESATTSRGGIDRALEFRVDGTFVEAPPRSDDWRLAFLRLAEALVEDPIVHIDDHGGGAGAWYDREHIDVPR